MFDGMDEDLDDLQFDFDDEDDDLLLAGAVDEASVVAGEAGAFVAGPSEDNGEDLANISFGIGSNVVSGTQHCDVSGFDRSAGQLWIYPTNYPVRDYQYNIVQQALHRNTLVVLPTGLGKTFIAAVLMYNMYRWFPQGKVVFMAPTKPLVAQQINACYTIVGIPKEDTVEMTGNMNPVLRERMWRQKRVIFLTPQVMTNDLSRGSFSGTSIKCLVVDEAHKAVGNHSYCQVVQGLLNFTQEFRVLALSATPGSDLKGVQQVMCNLLIAHIELRSEESIDIRPYTHERKVDKIVVPMGEELSGIRLKYIQIMEIVVNRLINQRVLFNREATKLSKFLILKARDEYRQNPPSHMQGPQFGAIEADFATAMSLYHGFELLQLHGLRSLYNYLLGIQSGDKGYGRTRYELCRNPIFIEIMEELQGKFALKKLNGLGQEKDAKMAVGHPKMQRLEEIVVEHFKSFQEKNMDTRVMIFSQYRDSVEEIRNILNQHRPLVKAMMFIGQSSVGKSTKGYTQKEQLEVMKQFREGGYNTLVSTCVGEEGLDIGDVDLIVCFDAHKSPIRLVQRMGRTGRKRTGRIVMLVTKGKEEQIYNQSLYSKKSIHKAILNGARTLHFYPHNPPLIPPGIKPKCHKMHITVKQPDTDNKKSKASTAAKVRPKGAMDSGSDISVALGKARSKQSSSELSNAEYEEIRREFCQISKTAKYLPRPQCSILSKNKETQEDSKDLINLSEWTPWQNRLQRAHFTGHSSTTHNLVQTCEFIELQQSIGEDANSYGLEMRLYLNKTDVKSSPALNQSIANVSGQSSIKSFFTPSQSSKQGDQSSKINSEKSDVGISKKSEGDAVEQSKKVNKRIKKSKKNGASKSSRTLEQSASNSSALFTSILPVIDKQAFDFDVEMIDIETASDKNVKSVSRHTCDEKPSIQKKGARKKKLLNKEDVVWKDKDTSREPGKCTNKEKNRLKKSNSIFGSTDQNRDVGEEYVFHPKGDEENCKKQSSTNSISRAKVDSFVDDAIEMYDAGQGLLEENSKDVHSHQEHCDSVCMIPSPPRVDEVAEIFESLESPIDFASLDVYQLVVGWDKFGERGELLKSPLRSLTLTSALAEKKNFPAIKFKSRINENVHSATKVNGSKSFSFDKVESGLHNDKQFKVHNVKLSNALMSSSTLGVPESEISIPKLDQEDVIHIESDDDDDVLDNSLKSNGQIPSPEKSNTDKTNELNDASYQYVLSDEGNTEPQPSKDSSITKKLFIDVAHDQISHTTKDSEKSPTCLSNSVNEAMNAIDLDDHPFSPPFSKRKTSQGKLGDTPIKSVSAGNISLATFTQALGCLHSSLLSPTNSTPRKDSSILSPLSEKRIDKPCTENFTNLKPSPSFPVSSTRKGSLPHEVFTSTPVFEKCINNKTSEERQSILDTKQNLNSTSNKPAGDSDFDDFGFEDDWCASDIIPPTPPKNNSGTGRSTVTVDTKDKCSQSTFISSRKSNATVQEEQIGKRQPYDKTNPIFSNRLKGSSKLPKNNLNPLQLIGNTALRSDRKRSEPIEPLAQNCSKNEENVLIPFHCGDDSDKALQFIEDTEDCIILSPLSKNQNAVCIEILDSQSQQQPQNSFPSSPPTLHSKHAPEKPQPLPLPLCDTPTTSRTASKSFLSSKKKKKLSLKTAGGSSFEEDCHKSRTPAKTKTTSGKVNFSVSSLRSMANGISASTPLAKHLSVKMMDDDYDVVDAMLAMDHLTPIKGITSTPNNDGDVEKSFIIRRKRKPAAVLEESSSDIESGDGRKNSWLCAQRKSDQNESKDSKKDKSKSFEDWQAACLHGVEDEDDFEEMETFSKGKKNPSGRRIERKSRPMKKLKKNAGFVDNEADVSGSDASSDEYDGDGDDCYEGSFINNDTEMMQTQADGTDMRAVYLKSVKSPVHGKYRLQFNHAHNTDIFSQAVAASQGMSEYEEDSFCVGSDEEESPVRKPKKKHMDRRKGNGQKKEKNGKNRRVVCISNSSDEGDDDNGFPFTQEVTTNQRVMAQKALMSSSEDENLSENDKEDGVSRKNWDRMANVLNDTDDAYKDLVTTKAHFSTSTVIESAENHFTQKKNIGDMSALPDLDRGSLSKSNVASKSALMRDGDGAVKTVNVSNMEEWMDDFDAADMNFDSPMLAPQKPSEETQVPNYCKEYESDHPMPGKGKTGLDSIQGSSKNFVRDQSVSGWSSTDQNRDSEHSNTSFERLRASSSVAFVKPMDRNCNETSSIDLVSNNKEDRTNSFYPSENIKNLSGNRDISREERLKRQKEKQERFRQKLAQVQQQQRPDSEVSKVSKHEDELTSKADASDSYVNPALSSLTRASSSSFSTYQSPTITSKTTLSSPSVSNYASNSSNSSVNVSTTAGVETLHILVDSREISGAQDVISTLRLEYNVTVTAKQLASCDYVLSNHLVVDRMCWSAFSNGANRSKLTSRLCEMQTLYRKYAIIVEADKVKVKTGQESNRKCNVFHSKYTDRTMASIIQTGVKMYFTDSAEQTASLLSKLCQAERRKGRHLAVPVKLKAQKEGMFNFIMSIPQINIMEALNLVHKYSNLREFVISPVAVLQKRGCFTSEKAQLVYSYLRHGCQLKSRA